jgi:hypothetical protein
VPDDPYADPITGILRNKLGAIMPGDAGQMRKMLDTLVTDET